MPASLPAPSSTSRHSHVPLIAGATATAGGEGGGAFTVVRREISSILMRAKGEGGEGEERGLDTVRRVFHSFILSFIDHMV